MKLIDMVISDIPRVGIETYETSETKYVADSRVLLDNLRDFEVEIPNNIYEQYKQDFGNGVLQYMEKITGVDMENFKGYNTYNWSGNIIHDFHYITYEMEDHTYYVAIQVHRTGDVRCNYTDFVLLKFENVEEWFEVVDEITRENFNGCREVNNRHYYYEISIFSEYIQVWCEETKESFEIYAYDDESFDIEINKIK